MNACAHHLSDKDGVIISGDGVRDARLEPVRQVDQNRRPTVVTTSELQPVDQVAFDLRFREADIAHCVDEWTVTAVERSWSA